MDFSWLSASVWDETVWPEQSETGRADRLGKMRDKLGALMTIPTQGLSLDS